MSQNSSEKKDLTLRNEEMEYASDINPIDNSEDEDLLISDPKKIDAWKRFISPDSDTYSNIRSSAKAAGFDDEAAASFVSSAWLRRRMRRFAMPNTAEALLQKYLRMNINTEFRNKDDAEWARVQIDLLKFTLKTLKKHVYSERVELTGKKGGPIRSQISSDDYARVSGAIKAITGVTKESKD